MEEIRADASSKPTAYAGLDLQHVGGRNKQKGDCWTCPDGVA